MFRIARTAAFLALALLTSACVTTDRGAQRAVAAPPPASKNISPEEIAGAALTVASAPFEITDVKVIVPEYLVVSEADVYLPYADIVWREDPLGDRRQQVGAILEDALRKGTAGLKGQRKVILAAEVEMFHALTDKARATFGGKHNVQFDYVLIDAETGVPVTAPKRVDASLKAYGGRRAYEAMRAGQTQKVRITNHVAEVIRKELTRI